MRRSRRGRRKGGEAVGKREGGPSDSLCFNHFVSCIDLFGEIVGMMGEREIR